MKYVINGEFPVLKNDRCSVRAHHKGMTPVDLFSIDGGHSTVSSEQTIFFNKSLQHSVKELQRSWGTQRHSIVVHPFSNEDNDNANMHKRF